MQTKTVTNAFTLIELLVVIAIIGLLATLATVAFGTARMKARDTKRIADVKAIQNALELFYDDNGAYIRSASCAATVPSAGWCNSSESITPNNYWIRNGGADNLTAYLAEDPIDPDDDGVPEWPPTGGGTYYYYSRTSSGLVPQQWYMIVFGLEQTDHPIQNQDGVQQCGGNYYHYGNGSDGLVTIGVSCKY